MKTASKAMDQVQKKMNLDEMEDIKDNIIEQQDRFEEITDFFAESANKDKDELMNELDEMMAMDQMDDLNIGGGYIEPSKEKQAAEQKEQQ